MPKMSPSVFGAPPNTSCHGIDPEVFLVTAKGGPFAAHQAELPPAAQRISSRGDGTWGYSLYRDGWAAEINTEYGGECRAFVGNCVRYALYDLAKRAKAHKAAIRVTPIMKIPLDVVRNGPKDLQETGCNPSHNAYTGIASVPSGFKPLQTPFRSAGVHLHTSLGLSKVASYNNGKQWWKDFEAVKLFVKMADVYVGLPYTYLLGTEAEGLRRQFYGKAGEFRFRDYGNERGTMGCGYQTRDSYPGGIEYRTPGGEVMVDHALINMGFAVLRRLYLFFDEFAPLYEPKIGEQIRRVIDKGEHSPDLLDLVQPCPGVYTKSVLQHLRAVLYGKLTDADFTLTDPKTHFGWSKECHTGWYERVAEQRTANAPSLVCHNL